MRISVVSLMKPGHLHRHFDALREHGREEGTEKGPAVFGSGFLLPYPPEPLTCLFFPGFLRQILNGSWVFALADDSVSPVLKATWLF